MRCMLPIVLKQCISKLQSLFQRKYMEHFGNFIVSQVKSISQIA